VSPASTAAIESTDDPISNLRLHERRVQAVNVTRVSFDRDSLEIAMG